MINNTNCKHESVAPANFLEKLSDSQAGPGRHKCGVCAYSDGFALAGLKNFLSYSEYSEHLEQYQSNFYKCKHGSIAPTRLLEELPDGQGGLTRHKCVTCAFKIGFELGLSDLDPSQLTVTETAVPNQPFEELILRDISVKVGRLKNDERNVLLGDLGEKAVMEFERRTLKQQGYTHLAEKVEQVSATVGDHLGFDVLSYNSAGDEKWIEVKTTTGHQNTKFHISENQIQRSESNPDKFWLYRLYDFNPELNATFMFKLNGNLRNKLHLYPTNYRALPK